MKRSTCISTLAVGAMLAGAVLAPTQVGAQNTRMCGGEPVTIMGTSGDDVIEGTLGPDVIFAAQGNDMIFGWGGDDIICAGKGDDVVRGGDGFDIIYGAQGDDVLFSANGSSEFDRSDIRGARMFGGAGNDLLVGSDRWDRMQGGPGVDHFDGYEGRDWIRGGGDTDYIDGGAGIDDTNGGNGNDHIRGTTGDLIRGSNGNDLCDLSGNPALLISCTESSQAFSGARHMPIVPPLDSGVEQMLPYLVEVINARDADRYEDMWAAECRIDAAIHEEWFAQNDRYFGEHWQFEIDFGSLGATEVKEIEIYVDFWFWDTRTGRGFENGQGGQHLTFLYEEAAWRIDACA